MASEFRVITRFEVTDVLVALSAGLRDVSVGAVVSKV